MFQIRRGVFETNSSSTHSICITKDTVLDKILDHVEFELGEFGWEYSILRSTYQKASYLYTAAVNFDQYNKTNYVEKIKQLLDKNDISCIFFKRDKSCTFENGYVDHSQDLDIFLEDVCNDAGKLLRYLFSSESFIITGNDNNDHDVDINVSYDHDEYYKGN